jgi:hypothetical protein
VADFFKLSAADQLEALNVAADASGRPAHLLEKDVWVVWALRHVFEGPFGEHLVFKGGTSLSKAYGVIHRFSEDVDLTYDIRAIAADLVAKADSPLPPSRSQEKKWSKEIRTRLESWVRDEFAPRITQALEKEKLPATTRVDTDKVFIDYKAVANGTGYVAASVMLEFGARATGEPSETREIRCDAAAYVNAVTFPAARAKVMRAERTFWEKATAIHVFCAQGEFRGGERFARHWHDLCRLHRAGFAKAAIDNKELAKAVAEHKTAFFSEKDPKDAIVDYHAAVSGALCLVPSDAALETLAADYKHMVDDGLLIEDAEPFAALLDQCKAIQDLANQA